LPAAKRAPRPIPLKAPQALSANKEVKQTFRLAVERRITAWLALGRGKSMTLDAGLSRSARSNILAHLRTLRGSIGQARDLLMHFRDDRVDRDRLEPAARRVDDLMNLFAGGSRDLARGSAWVNEILSGVEQVTNPKSAAALGEARVDLSALLEVLGSEAKGAQPAAPVPFNAGAT
jgi:hypothetical protein